MMVPSDDNSTILEIDKDNVEKGEQILCNFVFTFKDYRRVALSKLKNFF